MGFLPDHSSRRGWLVHWFLYHLCLFYSLAYWTFVSSLGALLSSLNFSEWFPATTGNHWCWLVASQTTAARDALPPGARSTQALLVLLG